MASHVLVIEDSLSGRLSLRSLLAAGHHEVSASTRADWSKASSAAAPDLILIGPAVDELGDLIKEIRITAAVRGVPILVCRDAATPEHRLEIIQAGARDILDFPISDTFLRARIRTLLREAEAFREADLRRSILPFGGFSDASAAFRAPEYVALVAARNAIPPPIGPEKFDRWVVKKSDVTDVLSGSPNAKASPGYILDWRSSQPSAAIRQVLPELRMRAHSRHSAILVLFDSSDPEAAVQALDSGASDVVPGRALADEIGYRISHMLERKSVEDDLRKSSEDSFALAMTDDLTGLYNRRYAQRYLQRLIEERATDQPFALMMADIDRFKVINDSFGHAGGDMVLQEVANRLCSAVRSVDLVARYGGEEFLIVLSESSLEEARQAADRLRKSIGKTPVRLADGQTIDVTVSIGVSLDRGGEITNACDQSMGHSDQMSELLSTADRALYRAKEGGRDQVQLAVNSA